MIRTTRWRPDTCGCVLEYEWDDTVPQDKRTHTYSKTVEVCEVHINLKDDPAHLAEILTENQGKNGAVAALIEANPHIVEEDDAGGVKLKRGVRIEHSYDADRKLSLKVFGAPIDTAATEAAIDAKMGDGFAKVI